MGLHFLISFLVLELRLLLEVAVLEQCFLLVSDCFDLLEGEGTLRDFQAQADCFLVQVQKLSLIGVIECKISA